MRLQWLTYLFVLSVLHVNGQRGSVRLSQREFLIGEQVTLEYSIQSHHPFEVEYNAYGGIIPLNRTNSNGTIVIGKDTDLEITSPFRDTLVQLGKNYEWIGIYEVTIWDSGYFQIPSHSIRIQGELFEFPACSLRVDLVSAKKGKTIYDIREKFTSLPEESPAYIRFLKNYWWSFLILLIFLLLLMKRKRRVKNQKEKTLPKEYSLKEKTLFAIGALNEQRLWEQGKLKEHYIELSYILRAYLSSRFELQLLEKTTQETMLLLRQKKVEEVLITQIKELLLEADLVKFAKSSPANFLIESNLDLAKEIVIQTSPLPFEYETHQNNIQIK